MRKKLTLAAVAVGALTVATIGIAAVANAASLPVHDSQLVTPAVQKSGNQFFTEEQLPTVWKAVVAHYPEKLAPGDSFPSDPPAFFTPEDGKRTLYQAGLVDEIANNIYDCSWLRYSLNNERASSAFKVGTSMLDKQSELPNAADSTALSEAVSAAAKATGTADLVRARYLVECGGK